jgi:uncharacterized protein YoxC
MHMTEKTWDMIYGAMIDLTKAVNGIRTEMNEIRTEMNEMRTEMNARFDRIESHLERLEKDSTMAKIKLFDAENEIRVLKERRA